MIVICCLVVALTPPAARGQKVKPPEIENPPVTDWLSRDYLIDVNDWRADLKRDQGITFIANYSVDVLSNPTGGLESATQYSTLGFFGFDIDLEKLIGDPGLEGWRLFGTGYNAEGRDLSSNIGSAIAPSNLFSGVVPVGLAELYLAREVDGISFRVGRITPGDYFSDSAIWYNYVSLAYDDTPWSLTENNVNFEGEPGALWMVQMDGKITERWSVSLGLANTSRSDITDPSKRGVDFHFNPLRGTLFMAEVDHRWEADFFGEESLVGKATLGGYYDTAKFDLLNPPQNGAQTNNGLGAAWVILEQQLIAGEDSDDLGLTLWAQGSWSGPQRMAPIPWFVSGGFVYQGIFPGRTEDSLAFGAARAWFSRALNGQNHETNLELTYLIQVTPWLQFQPDLQYIIRPNGLTTIDNAVVVGFQSAITF
ncbi:MAG: carbohydrate porin [Verrucomicrobiota bacterium]